MTRKKSGLIALFLLAGLMLFPFKPAHADLTITPWRVVFQDRDPLRHGAADQPDQPHQRLSPELDPAENERARPV